MKKYWFAQKTYGYGLVPISVEGWLMTFALVALILGSAYEHQFFSGAPTYREVIGYVLDIFILTTLFMLCSVRRMKGELAWRWGNRDNDEACILRQPQ